MKTYESERREIFEQLLSIEKEYSVSLKKRMEKGILSKDSEELLEAQKARQYCNLQFLELKVKYNIELTDKEKNKLSCLRKFFSYKPES